jgi:ATP-dependent DNA ligase
MRMSRTEGLTCRRALGDIAEWRAARLMRLRKPQGRPVVELFGRSRLHHACKMGLEGIVSKRKDSRYKSGRSPHWIKSKNPNAPAVRREAEEDWGR